MANKYHIKKFPTTCWLSGEDIVWCRATNEEGAKTFVNFSTTISDVSGALFILISILLNSKELHILTVPTCCHFIFVVLPDFNIAYLLLFCCSWGSYFQCLHLCKDDEDKMWIFLLNLTSDGQVPLYSLRRKSFVILAHCREFSAQNDQISWEAEKAHSFFFQKNDKQATFVYVDIQREWGILKVSLLWTFCEKNPGSIGLGCCTKTFFKEVQ